MLKYYLYLPPPSAKSYHPLHHLLYLTVWKPYLENHPDWVSTGDPSQCDLSNRDPIKSLQEFPNVPGAGKIFHHIRVFPVQWLTEKVPCAKLLKKNVAPFHLDSRANYYPPTFIFDPKNPDLTMVQYLSSSKKLDSKNNDQIIWYYKPSRGGGTKNITLSHSFKKLYQHACTEKKPAVLQREISNPLLYQGKKTEIRWYLVITYNPTLKNPVQFWWWPQGYLVVSPRPYQQSNLDTSHHFTNRCTSTEKERQTQVYQMTTREFCQSSRDYNPNFLDSQGKDLIGDICDRLRSTKIFQDKKSLYDKNLNFQYEVFAVDCIWSSLDYQLSLVEINRYPGLYLSRDIPSCRKLKTDFYQAILREFIEPWLKNKSISPNSFTLL